MLGRSSVSLDSRDAVEGEHNITLKGALHCLMCVLVLKVTDV